MTYEASGGFMLTPDQLDLLQASRATLMALEAYTPEQPPEEPDPEEVAWAEEHNCVIFISPFPSSFSRVPTPTGDVLEVYALRNVSEPRVDDIGTAADMYGLKNAPEGLRDLLVCFRGVMKVTCQSGPTVQDDYTISEVVGGPVALRGTALVSKRSMKWVESFLEVSPSLNATLTDRMVESGLYDEHDPNEEPLFDNLGGQDIIPMQGFMEDGSPMVLGKKDVEELTGLLLAAHLHGEPID